MHALRLWPCSCGGTLSGVYTSGSCLKPSASAIGFVFMLFSNSGSHAHVFFLNKKRTSPFYQIIFQSFITFIFFFFQFHWIVCHVMDVSKPTSSLWPVGHQSCCCLFIVVRMRKPNHLSVSQSVCTVGSLLSSLPLFSRGFGGLLDSAL